MSRGQNVTKLETLLATIRVCDFFWSRPSLSISKQDDQSNSCPSNPTDTLSANHNLKGFS